MNPAAVSHQPTVKGRDTDGAEFAGDQVVDTSYTSTPSRILSTDGTTVDALMHAAGVGVDWVTLSMLAEGFTTDHRSWDRVTRQRGRRSIHQAALRVPGFSAATLFVLVTWVPSQRAHYLNLASNPSRWVHPDDHNLCPFNRVGWVIEAMFDHASHLVTPAGSISNARVNRIDMARDFNLTYPQALLRGLEKIPQPKRRQTKTWADGATTEIQTLYANRKSQRHRSEHAPLYRLYDLSVAHPTASVGHWRFEAQVDQGRAERFAGVSRVADLTEERLARLLVASFDDSGWSTPVTGPDPFLLGLEHLDRPDGTPMTQADKDQIAGRVMRDRAGLAGAVGRHLREKHDHAIAHLGHPHGDLRTTHRLDLIAGTDQIAA